MGWSIFVNWPGADETQQGRHPGFFNDDHAWAEWVRAVLNDPPARAVIEALELSPLLVGAAVDPVWPEEVMEAATNLRILITARDPSVEPLVALYAAGCPQPDAPHDAFVQDLADVEAIARYAKECGADEMTLEYMR